MRATDLLQITTKVVWDGVCRVDLAQESPAEQDRAILGSELVYPRFDLRPEVSHQTLNWPSGSIAEGTYSSALNLFPEQREPMDA